eukprot:279275-Heterocapsa_arctica.AAC.1
MPCAQVRKSLAFGKLESNRSQDRQEGTTSAHGICRVADLKLENPLCLDPSTVIQRKCRGRAAAETEQ